MPLWMCLLRFQVAPPATAFYSTPQHGDGRGRIDDDRSLALLHDKYANDLPEFSLRSMRLSGGKKKLGGGSKAFEVEGGSLVDVELPKDLAYKLAAEGRPIKPGYLLYKTRSNRLKQRTEALSVAPAEYKLRRWRVVDVSVALRPAGEAELEVVVSISKLGEAVAEESARVPLEFATKEGVDVAADMADLFGVFGDAGVRVGPRGVSVAGLPPPDTRQYFIPRKTLKAVKQRLAERLDAELGRVIEARRDAALEGLDIGRGGELRPRRRGVGEEGSSSSSSLSPAAWDDRRFSIKVDRLEYLDALEAFLSSNQQQGMVVVNEVVFEPKRAFLAETGAADGVRRLLDFEERTGVPVRLAVPTVVRAWDEAHIRAWVEESAAARRADGGVLRLEVGNLGAMGLIDRWGLPSSLELDLASDFPLYALNSEATRVWSRMGVRKVALSIEDDAINLRNQLTRWPVDAEASRPQAIVYLDTPLFMAEACSLTALHGGCPGSKVCGYRTLHIENEDGEEFFVAHEQCKSVVYGKRAYSIAHKQAELLGMGVRDFKVAFTTRPYTPQAMTEILKSTILRARDDLRPIPETHTANYDRQLL